MVGDANGYIRGLDAKWHGQANDARIWRNSRERFEMETQEKYMVAGDAGIFYADRVHLASQLRLAAHALFLRFSRNLS